MRNPTGAHHSRRRMRRILLLASAPVVLSALVAVVWLLRPGIVLGAALDAYDEGRFAASAEQSSDLVDQFIVEPWIPYFSRGDALLLEGELVDAIDDFEKALELAPEEQRCMVRVNLAFSWRALGDQYAQAGFPEGAAQLYQAGRQVIADGAGECPGDARLERLDQELESGRQRAQADASPDDASAQGEQGKLDELEEKDQRGAQERGDSESRDRELGPVSTDRPW